VRSAARWTAGIFTVDLRRCAGTLSRRAPGLAVPRAGVFLSATLQRRVAVSAAARRVVRDRRPDAPIERSRRIDTGDATAEPLTMRPHAFALVVLAAFVVGCPKDDKKEDKKSADQAVSKDGKDDKSSKPASDDDDDGAGTSKPSKKKKPKGDDDGAKKSGDDADEGMKIAGVSVPAWKKPQHSFGKCAQNDESEGNLTALQKGDDSGAGFDDGKGDVLAIVASMKDACPSAGARVSQALNAGGYTRYAKKKYAQADGWFARALVADSSNTFARYNLACNLALEGKSDVALWNLGQLVPAARAGDPRALHYLNKAKSDSDLTSVRSDAKFDEATKAGDALGKAHPCDDGAVWDGHGACIHVCSGYGTKAGCPGDDTCIGTGGFERACVVQCDADDQCPSGKTCSADIGVPTIYNTLLFMKGCK
jgi:hypothetical protein